MAYSEALYVGNGVTIDYGVTFDYLDQSHVYVAVDKELTTAVGSNYKFEFINSSTVRVRTVVNEDPVPSGLEVRVFRQTPIDQPAVVFGGGASLSSANLNKNSEYLTYALQEATDDNGAFTTRYLGAFDFFPTTDNDGETLIIGAMFFDLRDESLNFWNGAQWKKGDILEASIAAKNEAEAAEASAEASANTATTQAGISTTKATEISDSAALSNKWANEDEDVVVSGGLFSSKHHAAKAAASAASLDASTLLTKADNLASLTNKATARTNLQLGTAAQANTGTASGNVPVLDAGGKVPEALLPPPPTIEFASQAEAEAGTNNTKLMTPLRTKQASAVKAWVNFNGLTMTINGSLNVSSLTDLGAGYYRINFTTNMSSTNYATVISVAGIDVNRTGSIKSGSNTGPALDKTVTGFRVITGVGSGGAMQDCEDVNIIVME